MKKRQMVLSNFICMECGKNFPIMRPVGRQRERHHIKDIWCPFCGRVQKFMEIRYCDWL